MKLTSNSNYLIAWVKSWLLVLISLLIVPLAAAKEPTIVVAANMKPAMEEIYAAYKKTSGQELRIIYGSSGNFMRQIQIGRAHV